MARIAVRVVSSSGETMNHRTILVVAVALALAGCSANEATTDYNLVMTDVPAIEYGRILCRGIPMEDRHTCLTSVIQHYQDAELEKIEPDEATRGPFVVVFDEDVYRGSYVSQPFAAAFTVSNGRNVCRGRYNAFAGDTRAIFKVHCDDGGRGTANIILDERGRNGIGIIEMDDGTRGEIVFGHSAVGGAF